MRHTYRDLSGASAATAVYRHAEISGLASCGGEVSFDWRQMVTM